MGVDIIVSDQIEQDMIDEERRVRKGKVTRKKVKVGELGKGF